MNPTHHWATQQNTSQNRQSKQRNNKVNSIIDRSYKTSLVIFRFLQTHLLMQTSVRPSTGNRTLQRPCTTQTPPRLFMFLFKCWNVQPVPLSLHRNTQALHCVCPWSEVLFYVKVLHHHTEHTSSSFPYCSISSLLLITFSFCVFYHSVGCASVGMIHWFIVVAVV